MRALDLFCGAGGATRGLQQAGFHVTGVDIKPQPRYCGDAFVQADALRPPFDPAAFDLIWASPPCQAFTQMSVKHRGKCTKADGHPELIDPVRRMLQASGRHWVIENVVGARKHMPRAFMLTGAQFGLGVHRPRLFETSFFMFELSDMRSPDDALGVYGKAPDGRRLWSGKKRTLRAARGVDEAAAAMGIDWMVWSELKEAIPPAYAEFIGRGAMQYLTVRDAAA